jgi:hypothetical protein
VTRVAELIQGVLSDGVHHGAIPSRIVFVPIVKPCFKQRLGHNERISA